MVRACVCRSRRATTLLFQGQEFGSSAPFQYFADHREDLREPIRNGRREFLSQFASVTDPEVQAALPVPDEEETFARCKLDLTERDAHDDAYRLHVDLIAIRRTDPAIAAAASRRIDGAVIATEAFVLRYSGSPEEGDRLLIVNLGPDLDLAPVPEPLLAPPAGSRWTLQWSSEAVRYGGLGRAPMHPHPAWHIPGEAAVLLRPEPDPENDAGFDDDAD